MIGPAEALTRVADVEIGSVVRTTSLTPPGPPLARAQAASMGVASGAIALDADAAEHMAKAGTPVILVRPEALTADINGMANARGMLTRFGGRTSHAAVVARQLGKVCLVACSDRHIDLDNRVCRIGEQVMNEGEIISLDGNAGCVYAGRLETISDRTERELAAISAWRGSAEV